MYDHISYARYLLNHFPEEAIKVPVQKGDHQAYSYHLGLAIMHDRREILNMILEAGQKVYCGSYVNLEHYFAPGDGNTALHLACNLLKGDLVLILLTHGATSIPNKYGQTPMDMILTRIASAGDNMKHKIRCLDHLLLFEPLITLETRRTLEENHQDWAAIMGEDVLAYLLGKRPAPLAMTSMRRILQQLPPLNIVRCLQQLQIPHIVRNSFSLGH
ncbi:ankyrin repeat domain-containing protein 9-like [Leptodactylus fuscus]|uniref:ankyrin repeat domain-containing protein 9-like n=1 Tax=Leptodactylus fuscus TaxID=238119 RepID=UPI003F4E4765